MTPDATHDSVTPDTQSGHASEPKYLLTITNAARALGVSVRTVQRRLDTGEYEAATVADKRCVRLRASDFPEGPPDDVTLDATGDSLDRTALKSARDATGDSGGDSTALVSLRGSAPTLHMDGQVQVLAALLDAVAQERAAHPIDARLNAQECAVKLLLSLDEAAVLSGLSRGHLRTAIADGELHAKRIGRGWKMRRADLEKYLQEVFK